MFPSDAKTVRRFAASDVSLRLKTVADQAATSSITVSLVPLRIRRSTIYYRNKIGIEETSEVLRNYLKRQDRQIDRLYTYAKMLRCEAIVRTYLEVLV